MHVGDRIIDALPAGVEQRIAPSSSGSFSSTFPNSSTTFKMSRLLGSKADTVSSSSQMFAIFCSFGCDRSPELINFPSAASLSATVRFSSAKRVVTLPSCKESKRVWFDLSTFDAAGGVGVHCPRLALKI